ncbi:MAG: DoxX family protein [Shimia sp.]
MNTKKPGWVVDVALLMARVLFGQLFVLGAVQKLVDVSAAQGLLADWGLPVGAAWAALGFNALAGAALILGWRVRAVAALCAAYCAVTSLFHFLPEDPWQMTIFVKNWALAGGGLALAVAGSGRYALRPDGAL